MISAIDHVEITTKNMEASIVFYSEVLGFQIKSRRQLDGSRGITEIAFLSIGDSVLEIVECPDAIPLDEERRVGPGMFALRARTQHIA
jgi:catechol 2,3-dioxygenase-like lactoylglutathione lyase family enzyme